MKSEELIKILKMVERRIITAEQAQQLIKTIEQSYESINGQTYRYLNININQFEETESLMTFRIPVSLASSVLKIEVVKQELLKYADIDYDQLLLFIEKKSAGRFCEYFNPNGKNKNLDRIRWLIT